MTSPLEDTATAALNKVIRANLAGRMGAVLAKVQAVGRNGQDYRVVPLYAKDGGTDAVSVPCVAGIWPQVDDTVWVSVNHRAFRQDTLAEIEGSRYNWQSTIITDIVRPYRDPHYVTADRITLEGSVLEFDLRGHFDNFEPFVGWHWRFQCPEVVSNAQVKFTTNEGEIEAADIYTTQENTPAGFSELGVYTILYADTEDWRKAPP